MTKSYIVTVGMADQLEQVLGPYSNLEAAQVGKRTAEQMQYKNSEVTYAEGGDTWVRVEERELIE